MSFGDPLGVYDIVGDLSSPTHNSNSALGGQSRDETPGGGMRDISILTNGWHDKTFGPMRFFTLPYLQKDKGCTAGKWPRSPSHETQAEQIQASR